MSEALELRIKQLIVEALMLEDVKPEDIETDAPLFVEGLGLDSIDALELAVVLHKEFGVRTKADDERNRENFFSVGSLAKFITEAQEQGLTDAPGGTLKPTEAGDPAADKTAADKTAADKPAADKPAADKPDAAATSSQDKPSEGA